MTLALIILCVICIATVAYIAALSRHRKSGSGTIVLVGQCGVVHTDLNPDGTVIINGELWPATSVSGRATKKGAQVKVTAVEGLCLVVEQVD
jgi:membrane-bound ClpP family serine protease